MELVRLCTVGCTDNWLGSSMNHLQGRITILICYWHALERRCLDLTAETGADDVHGGRVDGERRRGEQLDQSEGVLADKTARDLHSVPDRWSTFVPAEIDHISEKTIYPNTI